MASYTFIDDLLKRSHEAQDRLMAESKEMPKVAEKKVEEMLEVDQGGKPINIKMKTIRADPDDDRNTYSGKGHKTSPYDPCDCCRFPRGNLPGAYRFLLDGELIIRIVCLSCMTYFRKKGHERPSELFGTNQEAKEMEAQLSEARKRKRRDEDAGASREEAS